MEKAGKPVEIRAGDMKKIFQLDRSGGMAYNNNYVIAFFAENMGLFSRQIG